jgi:DNA integrity scanning protein DisA with diadenylate cyclase activity
VQESEKSRSQSLFHLELVSLLDHIAVLLRPLSLPVVESLLGLAIEIAQEGRILDPLAGHSAAARRVADPNLRGTIKELAQLDGAFVISESGVFLAACRYLDAKAAEVTLPLGLGARHMAAGAMSKISSSVGIVVSETATVRIFRRGRLIAQISCAPKPRLEEFLTPDIEAADEPFGT